MKLFHLIWVLGLAGLVAGCNSGPPIQGCDDFNETTGQCGDSGSGTGGGNGTGGTGGGTGSGACTNPDDAAVYMALEYTDSRGFEETGSDAASAIASDCVFGNFGSPTPSNPGCGTEAGFVVACALNPAVDCTPEEIDALTNCVLTCMQESIAEFTDGGMLTEDCAQCYGDSVSCSAENCAAAGCTNPNSQSCIQCRCDEDCTPGFDRCSGLPPSGDCG